MPHTVATGVAGDPTAPGSPQRRRGEQEAAAVVGAQPVGKLRQAPDLAQVHAGLEQAVLVQRQHGALPGLQRSIVDLNR